MIGVVLDKFGAPVPNMTVVPTGTTPGTVQALSADRQSTCMMCPTCTTCATSTNGVFVSTDAAFGTTYTVQNGMDTATGVGGLVSGKVTIVVLQLTQPII